jgi:mono/diheme cytochrome c family protein
MKSRHTVLWALLVILILVAAYGLTDMRRGFSASEQPSRLETVIARTMRNLAIPRDAKNATNPLPASENNLREGREHFADHCAFCHANDGGGQSETGPNLYPPPPDLRQSQTQNLTDGEIYSIIANGVRLTGMPASGHGPEDNWRLVLFVRHLPNLTPAEKEEMESIHPADAHDDEHHHGEGRQSPQQSHRH